MSQTEISSGDHQPIRFRRDAREDACEGLEYGSAISEAVADVAGDINSIPIIGKAAGVVTGCVAAVAHVSKAGMAIASTALKCDDIPFDEIKEIMDKRFNELERRMDLNSEAMNKVSEMVSKTNLEVEKVRNDMSKGFETVVEEIQHLPSKESINQIHTIVDYFNGERSRIQKLSKDEYVAKLEEDDGILEEMRNHRTSKTGSLHNALYRIIENNDALTPKNAEDKKAFQTLYALYYGAQSYVAIFGFLLESHSFLADYYYEKGNYEEFNKQVDKIKSVYDEFNDSLVKQNNGVLRKVKSILETIKKSSFVSKVKDKLFKELSARERSLGRLITRIAKMELPVIRGIPPTAIPEFRSPEIHTPVGDWKNGISVRYAVQYEAKGMFSKLSPWSEKLKIEDKASPFVKVKVDSENRKRLVFRQIDNDKPQLVAILSNPQIDFRDINRDLYNAAGAVDKDAAKVNVKKLIESGADVNVIYEGGRSTMHRAAANGNKDVMNILLRNGFKDINLKDNKGYTPLHLAAESGTKGFIPEMVTKGATADPTTEDESLTPLHLASKNGFRGTVAELLTKTQNVNAGDKNGYTPLHYAISGGKKMVEKFYQSPNIEVNCKSDPGLTPLHLATINGVESSIEALHGSGKLNPDVGDINGMTALHFAAMLGKKESMEALLKIDNININAKAEHNKWTPLHYAIYFNKEAAFKLLKNETKINVKAKAAGGVTPLHFAIMKNQRDFAFELMVSGADIEDRTDEGYTALHLAAMVKDHQIASLLMFNRANVSALSNANESPYDIAKKFKNKNALIVIPPPPGSQNRREIETPEHDISNPNSFRKGLRPQNLLPTFSGDNPDAPLHSLKLEDGTKTFKKVQNYPFQNFNPIGTLLLLDLILRKITKERFGFFASDATSDLDNEARALKITENFEGFLESLSDSPIENQVDFSEIHSKVKKALTSENESKIANILCSYAEKLSSLDSNKLEKLTAVYKNGANFINAGNLPVNEIHALMENYCGM